MHLNSMRNRKPGPYLVHSRPDMGPGGTTFETGEFAPETGIYRVVHTAHRLPHEVIVVRGQRFPKCQKCGDSVLFELLHSAPDLFRHKIPFTYELPVIDDDEDSTQQKQA